MIYVYIYTHFFHMHTCIYMHKKIYIYIYMYRFLCINTYIYTYLCSYTCTHAYLQRCSFTFLYMYTQMYSHINISIYTPTHLPTYQRTNPSPSRAPHLSASQVEAAQSRRLLSLEETVMLRDRKISELQAQVAELIDRWGGNQNVEPPKNPKTRTLAPDFFCLGGGWCCRFKT